MLPALKYIAIMSGFYNLRLSALKKFWRADLKCHLCPHIKVANVNLFLNIEHKKNGLDTLSVLLMLKWKYLYVYTDETQFQFSGRGRRKTLFISRVSWLSWGTFGFGLKFCKIHEPRHHFLWALAAPNVMFHLFLLELVQTRDSRTLLWSLTVGFKLVLLTR